MRENLTASLKGRGDKGGPQQEFFNWPTNVRLKIGEFFMAHLILAVFGLVSSSVLASAQTISAELPKEVAARAYSELGIILPDFLDCQNAFYPGGESLDLPIMCMFSGRHIAVNISSGIAVKLNASAQGTKKYGSWASSANQEVLISWPFIPNRIFFEQLSDRSVLCARRSEAVIDFNVDAKCFVQYSSSRVQDIVQTIHIEFQGFDHDLNVLLDYTARERATVETEIQLIGLSVELN